MLPLPHCGRPGLVPLERLQHIQLHKSTGQFNFLHESAIAWHNGHWYVAWNNSPIAESQSGTVVRWICCDAHSPYRSPNPVSPWNTPPRVWR